MSSVPAAIADLVARFERNLPDYKAQGYQETQLRREFLDPFFDALGWDVANRAGHAEAYKDVIHEDAITIGGYTKAPDTASAPAARASSSWRQEAFHQYQRRALLLRVVRKQVGILVRKTVACLWPLEE